MVTIRRAAAITATLAVVLAACSTNGGEGSPSGAAAGGDCKVGVAWTTFQEERSALGRARHQGGVEAAGGIYVGNDAG